jgi:hypothetical protein
MVKASQMVISYEPRAASFEQAADDEQQTTNDE